VGQDNLRPGAAVNLMELDGRALAESERPQADPSAPPMADMPSLEEIEQRLIERGVPRDRAREMAARIQRGETPSGMGGGAGGRGGPGGPRP
jgi:hypothetical protein